VFDCNDFAKKALILETPENPALQEGEELRIIQKIANGKSQIPLGIKG
jgi:hypothetical protein